MLADDAARAQRPLRGAPRRLRRAGAGGHGRDGWCRSGPRAGAPALCLDL